MADDFESSIGDLPEVQPRGADGWFVSRGEDHEYDMDAVFEFESEPIAI